jgi:two-component system chemotaxis response regulator CheB
MTGRKKIRIVVVDDSQTARELLVGLYESAGMQVVAVGKTGEDAVKLAAAHKPDVISMDVFMPKMDGLTATRAIMREHPARIVIVSARLTNADVELTFKALGAGALAALPKPGMEDRAASKKLIETIELLAGVPVVRRWAEKPAVRKATSGTPALPQNAAQIRLISIASSTGGPETLVQILKPLPQKFPTPIIIVQHFANGFADGLAAWLNGQIEMDVVIAERGDRPKAGQILLPPDDYHIQINKSGAIELSDAPPYMNLRPSANYLFHSMAEVYRANSMGIILTGMGDDGAEGMEALRQADALTVAQEEESCVVYGMPGAAVKRNAIKYLLTPEQISRYLLNLAAHREVK